jgi:hypothetical protein
MTADSKSRADGAGEDSARDQPGVRLFMVEHDLRDLSLPQRAIAHDGLGEAVRRAAARGGRIRYVQQILVPDESRCLCLFEAAGADLVRIVNDVAQFPLARIVGVRSSVFPGSQSNRRAGDHGGIR